MIYLPGHRSLLEVTNPYPVLLLSPYEYFDTQHCIVYGAGRRTKRVLWSSSPERRRYLAYIQHIRRPKQIFDNISNVECFPFLLLYTINQKNITPKYGGALWRIQTYQQVDQNQLLYNHFLKFPSLEYLLKQDNGNTLSSDIFPRTFWYSPALKNI